MDEQMLREFTELAKHLNFTKTSRLLNMTQPTLSKHIGALERELRLPLFDRSGPTPVLTRAGAELLPWAYKVLEAQDAFHEQVALIRSKQPARLVVSGYAEEKMANSALGKLLSALAETYGTGFLELNPLHGSAARDALASGKVDLVFEYTTPEDLVEDALVDMAPIGSVPWVAVVGTSHPLASRDSLTISDLADQQLLRMEGASVASAWRFIERACNRHGFTPQFSRRYSKQSSDLLTASASLGDEVLILSAHFIEPINLETMPFCRIVPFDDPDAVFPFGVLYSLDNANPLLDEALDALSAPAGNA